MKIKLSKSQWEAAGRNAGWLKKAQFMSGYEYLDIGPTPSGESCAQVGAKEYDYSSLSKMENVAFINQLKRAFPDIPQGVRIVRKSNPHDFGTYYEVNIKWIDGDITAQEYAYKVESNTPEFWDEQARAELTAQGYFTELEKGNSAGKKSNNDGFNSVMCENCSSEVHHTEDCPYSKGANPQ